MMRRRTLLTALVSLCLAAVGCARTSAPRDTERLERILQSSVEALRVDNYEEATRLCDEGLALSPGNPAFLINKSVALRSRGAARYNASLKLEDPAAVASEKEAARRDFVEAAALATEAVGRLKSAAAWDTLWHADSYKMNKLAAYSARADVLYVIASRFDHARADEALTAMREYMQVETDGERKRNAQLSAGQMLLDAGRGAEAAAEYQKVLAQEPDNLDATLGAGLALFQSGERARYEEAAAHLQRFVERAPEAHPLRASAKEALDFMSQQGIPPAPRR
ncbi:MAG TPA: tetratricopeptide repeat protein [Pyrinomonadaceae bacterium]